MTLRVNKPRGYQIKMTTVRTLN